ncbi:MAG: Cysteine desulfurase IscS [Gammaproteobacteria bacterium]|nr:Cysteine desulfurase IscS [Gammaproteobacteria bacterium]
MFYENKPIYLDYAAETPLDPRVAAVLSAYLQEGALGNPHSVQHVYGWKAKAIVDKAAGQIAELIHAQPPEILWTSGATESNNLAIKGSVDFYQDKGRHIITSATEHKAVLDVCAYLQKQGYEITYLKPQSNGVIAIDELRQAIRQDTILVSIMHVNNETGVMQDIRTIGKITRQKGILFHVDAAQSASRLPINVNEMGIDLLSLSSHKVYGPAGIGALYVRQGVQLTPLIQGGGHQSGFRSGSLPVLLILGMGKACELMKADLSADREVLQNLTKRLWAGIQSLESVRLNGELSFLAPGYLNATFEGIDGDAFITALTNVAVSSKAACTSAAVTPSHVLIAMGLREQAAQNAVRFSLGRMTTTEEIDEAVKQITYVVIRLRALSPVWELLKEGKNITHYPWQVLR